MRFVNQNFVEIKQTGGIDGVFQMVEQAGRTSYKSEDGITADSAKKFVNNMVKSKHYATLEFGTVYLTFPTSALVEYFDDGKVLAWVAFFKKNPYSRLFWTENNVYVTTNYRVIVENGLSDVLEFMASDNKPTLYHKKRYCMKLTTCRQVTHEAVRHRVMSFLQESTRYCLYLKDKFNKELTFINDNFLEKEEFNVRPQDDRNWFKRKWDKFRYWLVDMEDPYLKTPAEIFEDTLKCIEDNYLKLAAMKKVVNGNEVQLFPTQFLALLLPNLVKADICVCAFADEWEHFFALRTTYIKETGAPHPLMGEIADAIYDYFIDNKYISLEK